jgi:5-amino-6-(5-phosphoribosylamino)uracil reductase/diaminohydroxyphosphoribosylaminopyrimidine deaminase/5-amino-6-(5-phosphoribosylamino)uracil reductase
MTDQIGSTRPFVTVKYAQTLDGRTATATGDSKWISGPESLRFAHELRAEHDAILVGVRTVLADDPQLNVRLVDGRDPLRVIIDTRLETPPGSRVLSGGAARGTLIVTSVTADAARAGELQRLGAEVITAPRLKDSDRLDLRAVLVSLQQRAISSILVEGGAAIVTSLLVEKLVDRLIVAIAPKLVGSGLDGVGDLGIRRLADALTFSSFTARPLGNDLIFDGQIDWKRDWNS